MRWLYILGAIVVCILVIVYYQFDPKVYSYFPECPFHKFTGLDCPGCGSQRAVHALLRGNIAAAADFNLLLVLSIPFLSVHVVYTVLAMLRKNRMRWKVIDNPLTPKIILAVVLVFWIVRNIPFQGFGYLAA